MSQLSFFNTCGLEGQNLAEANQKAERQEWRVYDILLQFGTHLTPVEVWKIYCKRYPESPLTSIRRSLTRGTKAGIFEKVFVSKKGLYNLPNWQWKAIKQIQKDKIIF